MSRLLRVGVSFCIIVIHMLIRCNLKIDRIRYPFHYYYRHHIIILFFYIILLLNFSYLSMIPLRFTLLLLFLYSFLFFFFFFLFWSLHFTNIIYFNRVSFYNIINKIFLKKLWLKYIQILVINL